MSEGGEKHDHLPFFRSPVIEEPITQLQALSIGRNHKTPVEHLETDDESSHAAHGLHHLPAFRHYAETTHAELFYDLFFVANLTVFTAVHEVNDATSFKQYIGFFSVLWMTWYQVSLYDVRFSVDSVLDRIAKALQFGVMIGFAIVGPQFNVGTPLSSQGPAQRPNWQSFCALSMILMTSRLILVCQYVQAVFFTRNYKNVKFPLAAIAFTYAVTAFIYLGLFFTFSADGSNKAYIAWYIIAVTETVVATTISSIWRAISFKGTHLVQRMGLLTLIILGEGVIGAAVRAQLVFTSAVIGYSSINAGNIVALILSLYFIYMLYFDWVEDKHFGTIRQQVWAFLHFPLHMALVVAVEGAAQVFTWTAANAASDRLLAHFSNLIQANVPQEVTTNKINELRSTASTILGEYFVVVNYAELDMWTAERDFISEGFATMSNFTRSFEARSDALTNVFVTLNNMVYGIARFTPPEHHHHSPNMTSGNDDEDLMSELIARSYDIYHVFALTFAYFFISIGLVVILIGVIAILSKLEKKALHWIRLGANLFIGLALCCISIIVVGATATNVSPFDNYIASPWMLPTVALALFVAVLLNNIVVFHRPRSKLPG